MKLTISSETSKQINKIMTPNDVLVLDVDDGTGAFSKTYLKHLEYQLLIVDRRILPAEFNQVLTSNIGPVYFSKDTALFLDQNMRTEFKTNSSTYQLWSTRELLGNLPIKRAVPKTVPEIESE